VLEEATGISTLSAEIAASSASTGLLGFGGLLDSIEIGRNGGR
jgi:hypothetical protein